MRRLVIIGAGITGLATAHRLSFHLRSVDEILIFDTSASTRPLQSSLRPAPAVTMCETTSAVWPIGLEWESGGVWNPPGVTAGAFSIFAPTQLQTQRYGANDRWFEEFIKWPTIHKDYVQRCRVLARINQLSKHFFELDNAHALEDMEFVGEGNIRILESRADIDAVRGHVEALRSLGLSAQILEHAASIAIAPYLSDFFARHSFVGTALFPGDACMSGKKVLSTLTASLSKTTPRVSIVSVRSTPVIRTTNGKLIGVESSHDFISADWCIVAQGQQTQDISDIFGTPMTLGRAWGWTLEVPIINANTFDSVRGKTIGLHRNLLLSVSRDKSRLRAGGFFQVVPPTDLPSVAEPLSYLLSVLPEKWMNSIEYRHLSWRAASRTMTVHDLPIVTPLSAAKGAFAIVPTGHLGFTQYGLAELLVPMIFDVDNFECSNLLEELWATSKLH